MGRLNVLSRSGSPVFNEKVMSEATKNSDSTTETMTVSGVANKTGLLTFVVFAIVVGLMYAFPIKGDDASLLSKASTVTLVSGIVGLVMILVMCFKQDIAKYIAFPYAACEGAFLWGFVAIVEINYPGIATTALFATIGLLVSVTLAYKTGLIKVNETFLSVFKVATVAVFVLFLLSFITSIFFKDLNASLFDLKSSGLIGIGISLFLIFWGSMSLVLDINLAEEGAQQGAPKDFEWYCAVSLLITIVYIYVEMIRLLIQLANTFRD